MSKSEGMVYVEIPLANDVYAYYKGIADLCDKHISVEDVCSMVLTMVFTREFRKHEEGEERAGA